MKKLLFGILVSCCLVLPVLAQTDSPLRDDHPDVYTVQKGDTLWGISSRFLRDPWLWQDVWQANPQIENPHLIFPGDRVTLVYVDGQARLTVDRGGVVKLGPRDIKLSPEMTSTPIDDAIPAIPLEEINAFLSRSRIVVAGELDRAPYVVSGEGGNVVVGAGDRLYARGNFDPEDRVFGIFREGQSFIDPDSGELLGFEAIAIGRGRMVDLDGDIATLTVNSSNEEIRRNDRLLPYVEERISATFFPSAPENNVSGMIMAVEGGVTQVGHMDIVVVNLGSRAGIAEGNVLAIDKIGEVVPDPVTREPVKLPDTRAGLLMVFRVFEKMSYGMVINATRPLKVMDNVHRP